MSINVNGKSKKQIKASEKKERKKWLANQQTNELVSASNGQFATEPSYLDMLNASYEMTNNTNARTFDFNAAEAEKSRMWQTAMSNTAHQREVSDLKLAGLNPVLSANGGAMSYSSSGASASSHDPSATLASLYNTKATNATQTNINKLTNATNKEITAMNNAVGLQQSKYAYSAAKTTAAATRDAAAASAAATMAAAATSAEAAKYNADKNYETQKYVTDNSKNGSWAGIIENIMDKYMNPDDGTFYDEFPGLTFHGVGKGSGEQTAGTDSK